MKKQMKRRRALKRAVAWGMTAAMLVGLFPSAALAAGANPSGENSAEITEEAESVEAESAQASGTDALTEDESAPVSSDEVPSADEKTEDLVTAPSGDLSGSGTEEDPYIIKDISDWELFAAWIAEGKDTDKYYALSDDFSCGSNYIETAVGTVSHPFEGVFDGNGNSLAVMISIDEERENAVGPFRYIKYAAIKNLSVWGIVHGNCDVGGLVGASLFDEGETEKRSLIENCTVYTGINYPDESVNAVGGVVGNATESRITIKNTYCNTLINGSGNYIGGLIGVCFANADIELETCLYDGEYSGDSRFHPVSFTNGGIATVSLKEVFYTAGPANIMPGEGLTDTTIANSGYAGSPCVTSCPEDGLYMETQVTGDTIAYEPVTMNSVPIYSFTGTDLRDSILSGLSPKKEDGTALEKDTDYTVTFFVKHLGEYTETDTVTAQGGYKAVFSAAGEYEGSKEILFRVEDTENIDTNVDTWLELLTAMHAGGEITLMEDVTPYEENVFLHVPEGVTVTLDLNGHTIDRGLNEGFADLNLLNPDLYASNFEYPGETDDGYVIRVDGELVIRDSSSAKTGKITGGNNDDYGGGLYVAGKCTLEGGTISGNHAYDGGGVYVAYNVDGSGEFTLCDGGAISGNQSQSIGGGIIGNGKVTISGGSVDHNVSAMGGGLYLMDFTYIRGGNISDNTAMPRTYLDGEKKEGIGGGIYFRGDKLEISDCIIRHNTAFGGGGGIGATGDNAESGIEMSGNVVITDNKRMSGMDSNVDIFVPNIFRRYVGSYINITGPLASTARIGISGVLYGGPAVENFSENAAMENFFSDDPVYILVEKEGTLWTQQRGAAIITAPSVDGFDWYENKYMPPFYVNEYYNRNYRKGIAYTGEPQVLLSDPGLASDGTMMYAIGDKDTPPEESDFSEELPMAKGIGVYYIWYKAKGKENYGDTQVYGPLVIDIIPAANAYDASEQYIPVLENTPVSLSGLLSENGFEKTIVSIEALNNTTIYQENGEWMLEPMPCSSNVRSMKVEMSDGFICVVKVCPFKDMGDRTIDVILYPNDCVHDPIEVTVDKNGYYLPDIHREGYRLVCWRAESEKAHKPGELITPNAGYDGDNRPTYEHNLRKYIPFFAQWEKTGLNLVDEISPIDSGEEVRRIFMGGESYTAIGKGDGKTLYIAEKASTGHEISQAEQGAMLDTTYRNVQETYYTEEGKLEEIEIKQHPRVFDLTRAELVWFLKTVEKRSIGTAWGLADRWENKTCSVKEDGTITGVGSQNHRYAFVLDDSRVLFSGQKPSADGSFGSFLAGNGPEKLTLLDESRALTVSADNTVIQSGGAVSLHYENANTGEKDYISCMLLNENGEPVSYAGQKTEAQEGTWNLSFAGIPEGIYAMKVFSEQRNGEKESDFAGRPEVIYVRVVNGEENVVPITGENQIQFGDTTVLTASGADATWTSLNPEIAEIDAEGKVTGKGVGKAAILAESETGTGIFTITVTQRVAQIGLSYSETIFSSEDLCCPDLVITNQVEGSPCKLFCDNYYTAYEIYHMMTPFTWADWYQPGVDGSLIIGRPWGEHHLDINQMWLDNPNYVLPDAFPDLTFTIHPRVVTLTWGDLEFEYDGESHAPTVTGSNFSDYYFLRSSVGIENPPAERDLTVDGAGLNAGTYEATAVARYTDAFMEAYPKLIENHDQRWPFQNFGTYRRNSHVLPDDRTVSFRILPKKLDVTWGGTKYIYDGNAHQPTIAISGLVKDDVCEANITKLEMLVDNTTWTEVAEAREVGTYRITAAVSNGNYALPEEEEKHLFYIWKDDVNPFEDVEEGKYYYDSVMWAINQEPPVTTGVDATHYAPKDACTRAQVVTFLWRIAGCPEPTIQNPFTDVKEGKYYYKAVLWAYENGITTGKSETTFDPSAECTRGQFITFLWRMAGEPEVTGKENPFEDVAAGKYYETAVLWAYENHITTGTDDTHFSPGRNINRGQTITFIHRFCTR